MKKFMARDKEFNDDTFNQIKNQFQPNPNQYNITPQYMPTEYMMSNNIANVPPINIQITEDDVLDNIAIRRTMLNRTNELDRIKGLVLISNLEYCTIKMCADYFEVDFEIIKKCIQRNRDELIENGLISLSGKDVKNMINNGGDIMSPQLNEIVKSSQSGFEYDGQTFNNKKNTLLNRRVILNIAMLLRDSNIAKIIRKLLLDTSEYPQVIQLMNQILQNYKQVNRQMMLDINRTISKVHYYMEEYTLTPEGALDEGWITKDEYDTYQEVKYTPDCYK